MLLLMYDTTFHRLIARVDVRCITSVTQSAVATRVVVLSHTSAIIIRTRVALCKYTDALTVQAKSKGLEVQLAEARQRQAEAATAQVHAQAAVAQASADARDRCAHQELTAATAALTDYQDTVTKSSEVY